MVDKEPFESLTGIAQQTADRITQQTKVAMENYLTWFQNASQWANVDLNKKLLSYAAENVTNAVGLVQKLSQAKNVEQVLKIQTEFMSQQLNSFNEQTKTMRLPYARNSTSWDWAAVSESCSRMFGIGGRSVKS
jgi:hypothetical protein